MRHSGGLLAEMLSRTYSSISGRGIEPSTASMNSSWRFSGRRPRCFDRPDGRARRRGLRRLDRAPLQPDAVGGPRTRPAASRSRVSPTEAKFQAAGIAAQVGGEALVALQRLQRPLPLGDVALAAALRLDHAARPQRREQAREEQLVVEDPVEGGVREDRVDLVRSSSSSRSETISSTRSPGRRGSRAACSIIDARAVDADHAAVGQALDEQAWSRARCRSRRRGPSRHRAGRAGRAPPAPLLLRRRDLVIGPPRPTRPAPLTAPS